MVFSNTAQSFPIQGNVYCLIRMTAFKIQLLISGLLWENWLKITTHLVGYDKRNVCYWVSRDQTSVIKMLVWVHSLKIYRKYVFWVFLFVCLLFSCWNLRKFVACGVITLKCLSLAGPQVSSFSAFFSHVEFNCFELRAQSTIIYHPNLCNQFYNEYFLLKYTWYMEEMTFRG